jgi:DNA-binding MarR family transcriptional regulator
LPVPATDIDVATLLFQLAPRLTRLENEVLKDSGVPLTFRQYRLLLRVRDGASTLGELRTPSTLTLSAVSESVDGLVQRGLLTREVDPRDRRAITITTTQDGRAVLDRAAAALSGLGEELLREISPQELAHTAEVVRLVEERVSERLRRARS